MRENINAVINKLKNDELKLKASNLGYSKTDEELKKRVDFMKTQLKSDDIEAYAEQFEGIKEGAIREFTGYQRKPPSEELTAKWE